MKITKLRYLLAVILLISCIWIANYYPLHHSDNSPKNELELIYALNELKELQSMQVHRIEEKDYLGGKRSLRISAEGDVDKIFNEDSLEQQGWKNIKIEEQNISACRKNYWIDVRKENRRLCNISIVIDTSEGYAH
jgi:hypothetical protein